MFHRSIYSIEINSNVLWVTIDGEWDKHTDLMYLTDLSEAILATRGEPWGMVVDMRNWIVTQEYLEKGYHNDVALNRQNQIFECWLVKDASQGDVVRDFLDRLNIPLHKFEDPAELQNWVETHNQAKLA